jgi:putative acetyltransferase
MRIIEDDLTSAEVAALLDEHLDGMHEHSPPESVHELDLQGLKAPHVTFWTAWEGDELLGCGALKELDESHGEIKSMRTAQAHLGKGVASAILEHLVVEANRRCYARLSLETGSGAAFEASHALYLKFGFEFCGPFDNYVEDPFSRFMTREL